MPPKRNTNMGKYNILLRAAPVAAREEALPGLDSTKIFFSIM